MPAPSASLEQLTASIRACFNRLKAMSDTMCADLGVNASMRAVLEALDWHGSDTVPAIARAKRVSRQHIQVNMDALLERGLVTMDDNPAHKRSSLFSLSAKGKQLFAAISEREIAVYARLARQLEGQPLAEVSKALAALATALDHQLEGDNDNA